MAIGDGDENDDWGLMSESNFPRMIPENCKEKIVQLLKDHSHQLYNDDHIVYINITYGEIINALMQQKDQVLIYVMAQPLFGLFFFFT